MWPQTVIITKFSTSPSVLVSIIQRNRTNGIYIDMHKNGFIVGIGSRGFGGWEVPLSPIHQLENQESCWFNKSEFTGLPIRAAWFNSQSYAKAWEMEGHWYKSQSLKAQEPAPLCRSAREDRQTSQLKKRDREFTLFLFKEPSTNRMMPTHTGEGKSSLLILLKKMLISSRSTLQITPRK